MGSVKPTEFPFSNKIFEYLKEQGHITPLSPGEENRENRKKIEKRKVKAKIKPVRRAIVLDPGIGEIWCNRDQGKQLNNESGHSSSTRGLTPILKELLEKPESREGNQVDIWLDLERREGDWNRIHSLLERQDLTINRIWSAVQPEKKSYFQNWARDRLLPDDIDLALKTIGSNWGNYCDISASGATRTANLGTERLASTFREGTAYFSCPFIYNYIFFTENGSDYCPAGLQRREKYPDRALLTDAHHYDIFSRELDNERTSHQLGPIHNPTCPAITEKFDTVEDYHQSFFKRRLDETIEKISPEAVKQ